MIFIRFNDTENIDSFILLDGDYISCLLFMAVNRIFSSLSKGLQIEFAKTVKVGVVCTAYSNGAFMKTIKDYIGDMNAELVIAKTGVKYLAKAAENFDLAIEFEANGHGMINASKMLSSKLGRLNAYAAGSNDILYLELLSSFIANFNPSVGDSISVMLGVESALRFMDMSMIDFKNLYTPLLFQYSKLKVKDRFKYICNSTEERIIEPSELQVYIDELTVNDKDLTRCFVRPSGTEDVLRIYCESKEASAIQSVIFKVESKIILLEDN